MKEILNIVAPAIPETLYMVIVSTIIAVLVGTPLGIFLYTSQSRGLAEKRGLYRVLDTEWMSEVFAYLDDVGTYLEELEADDAADIIENMDADDAVDVLQEVDDNVREKLVSLMNEEATEDIELICSYDEDQIGSMMTTGSTRGKCSVPQAGQTRFQPPDA